MSSTAVLKRGVVLCKYSPAKNMEEHLNLNLTNKTASHSGDLSGDFAYTRLKYEQKTVCGQNRINKENPKRLQILPQ